MLSALASSIKSDVPDLHLPLSNPTSAITIESPPPRNGAAPSPDVPAGILVPFLALGLGYTRTRLMQPVRIVLSIEQGAYPQASDDLSSSARTSLAFEEFVA